MNGSRASFSTAIGLVIFIFMLAAAPTIGHAAQSPQQSIVVNTAANPVPVNDVNNAKQPFQTTVTVVIPGTSESASATFTVPAGKRLVIEFVSGNNTLDPGEKLRGAFILTWVGGGFSRHYLTARRGDPYPTLQEEYIISQPLKAYADSGLGNGPVEVSLGREFAIGGAHNQTVLILSISGYLVDVP